MISKIFLLLLISSAMTFSATGLNADNIILANSPDGNKELEVQGDPFGHRNLDNLTVYAFSQVECDGEDPQLYRLKPDISIRSFMKWERKGLNIYDYNSYYIKECRDSNIVFMGGGTATVISVNEPIHDAATMNAAGGISIPPYEVERSLGVRRASLANPKYRQYVVDFFKKQIDLGVDGVSFDEVYGYYGNLVVKWPWEKVTTSLEYVQFGPFKAYSDLNEGFDDYFISDFNRYLMNKYPDFKESDWISNFGMTTDNIIRKDVPYNDLKRNFNYRKYLKVNGWDKDPYNKENPLVKEWGITKTNHPEVRSDNFMEKYLKLYWKDMVVALRTYAREKYGKEILITANGIFPFVDFNSRGIVYSDNDEYIKDLCKLPFVKDRLNGKKSMMADFKKLLAHSIEMSGNVPLSLFIDFPTRAATAYYSLSAMQKMDFWRIYGAEAYASGVFLSFHLKTVMPDEPSASQSGILDFLIDYTKFYKENRELFHPFSQTEMTAEISVPDIACNISFQKDRNRYIVHLINHNYNGKMISQPDFIVWLPLRNQPESVTLFSPDCNIPKELNFKFEQGKIKILVDRLDFYDILEIKYGKINTD